MTSNTDSYSSLEGVAIAVIEDDDMIRVALQCILESWGCRVRTGSTGSAIINELNREFSEPDLILADYSLGAELNGFDAAQQIRKHAGREIPIVILSGDDSLYRYNEAREQGLRILEKPCPPIRLKLCIFEALATSDA